MTSTPPTMDASGTFPVSWVSNERMNSSMFLSMPGSGFIDCP